VTDNDNISVSLLKQKYLGMLQNPYFMLYGSYGKRALFRLFAQSHRNFLLNGWVEDGFCVPNPQDCATSAQSKLMVDFSVQAIAHEAMLEVIKNQSYFDIAEVDTTAWFYTDVILGESAW